MTINPGDTAAKEIERVARLLCKADGVEPPDQLVAFVPLTANSRGYTFIPTYDGSTGPAWQAYAILARTAINALRPEAELVSADRPVPWPAWIRDVKDAAHKLLQPGASRAELEDAASHLRILCKERVGE